MHRIINHKQNIFNKYLFSYLLILVLPVLVASYFYFEAVKIVEEESIRANTSVLTQTRDILDNRFREIKAVANQLSLNNKVLSLLNMSPIQDGSKDIYKLWDLVTNIPQYKLTNNFISEYYIIYKKSNIVVSSTGAYMDIANFYNRSFISSDNNFDKWYQSLFNSKSISEFLPSNNIKINGKGEDIIQYIQTVPLDISTNPNCAIIIFIKTSEVNQLLNNTNTGDTGVAFITNEKGQLVTYLNSIKSIFNIKDVNIKYLKNGIYNLSSNRKMLVSIATSSYNKWNYISIVPKSMVTQRVQYIKKMALILLLLVLLAGIFLAYNFAYRNSKPLEDIINSVKTLLGLEKGKDIDNYIYLNTVMTGLVKNKSELEEKLKKQTPFLQMGFIGRLLRGDFYDENEINNYASNINMDLEGEKFTVFITKIKGYDVIINKDMLQKLEIIKMIIIEILINEHKCKAYFYNLDESKMAVLMVFTDPEEALYSKLEVMVNEVNINLIEKSIDVIFSMGNIHSSIKKASNCFYEAGQALEQVISTSNLKIIFYKNLQEKSEGFYYPMEAELKLMSMVKSGNKVELKNALNNLFKINFCDRNLSIYMKKQLIYEMKGTIIKEAETLNLEDEVNIIIEEIDKSTSNEMACEIILKGHFLICDKVGQQKNALKSLFIEQVKEYVDKIYMNCDLDSCLASEYFKLSEAYLCQIFKEGTNFTFASYIENIRIDHASELLNHLDLDIKEVARNVGYCSDTSFRRAFKRKVGVTPTEYRNALRT